MIAKAIAIGVLLFGAPLVVASLVVAPESQPYWIAAAIVATVATSVAIAASSRGVPA